ncbi:MAG: GatB/YqeY domain-containing protein [Patescibacteria group bacterium]
MSLFSQIKQDMIKAMKEKDALVLDTLRMVYSALKNEAIDQKKADISDQDCHKILAKEVKKRKDSITAYTAGGRKELAEKEQREIDIIQKYLPAQMSEQEIEIKIREIIKQNQGLAFGPLMGKVMGVLKGKADGQLVQKILKNQISS